MENFDYNSQRDHLVIPEYGRNVQRMVDFCCTLEDREERNKVAKAIINVIGQLNPQIRDVEDFKHKLWDHLFIMSDFKLDVDSPYEVPKKETFEEKPSQLPYPTGGIKFGHYGKTVEDLLAAAQKMDEGEEKDALVLMTVNLMKKHYLMWNRGTVDDEVILKDLKKLTDNAIELKDPSKIASTQDLMRSIPKQRPQNNRKRQGGGQKNRRRRN